ncbi:MAG TPA: SPOR domain-containing protein [Rhizobacter sp.]|nr:SPOR domain-containing protein [Rhizobacter sp.]
MGLLSFFKRKAELAPRPRASESGDSLQQVKTRARQRLVGAVVLVAAGVIGFPLLFETQPRPVSVDIPIEIARKDGSAPPVAGASPTRVAPPVKPAKPAVPPAVIDETPSEAGQEVAAASAAKAEPAVPKPVTKPIPAAVKAPAAEDKKPSPPPSDSGRAQALLEDKPAPAPVAAPAAAGRFVVQVGAFAEAAAAREARQKVEKLGLKTYTQVVGTSAGNRIRVRVGPFASRDEADKAAGKIKSSGMSSAVYTL